MGHQSQSLKKASYALAAVAFASMPFWATGLDPLRYEGGYFADPDAMEQRNSSAIANILGGIRTSMSDMVFMKTERYLHSGVAYDAHMNTGAMAQSGAIESKETGEAHIEAATIIPTAEHDFRGFIGHLHRTVKPWKDPSEEHEHTAGTELLPWYRVMTLTDPHNIRGYMIGTWWLITEAEADMAHHAAHDHEHPHEHTHDGLPMTGNPDDPHGYFAEAVKFIEEGIQKNPKAFQLHNMHGRALIAAKREDEAMESFRRAAELGLAQRPKTDADNSPFWSMYKDTDFREAARRYALMLRDRGRADEAVAWAKKMVDSIEGGDARLQRLIDTGGVFQPEKETE